MKTNEIEKMSQTEIEVLLDQEMEQIVGGRRDLGSVEGTCVCDWIACS